MKKMSKILALVLCMILCVSLASVAFAAEAEKDGLKLTLTTDKTEYAKNEAIVTTLKVENASDADLSGLELSIIAPDGLKLVAGAATGSLDALAVGASETLEATFAADQLPETGDTSKVFVLLAGAVISALAVACLVMGRKRACLALVAVLAMGLVVANLPAAYAAETSVEVTTTVTVDGEAVTLKAIVTAIVAEPEASDPSENPSDPSEPAPSEPAEVETEIVLDFEDGKTGEKYVNPAWSQETYKDDWTVVSSVEMNCRNNKVGVDGTTTKFVNFVADGAARKFTYTLAEPLATVTSVSVDVGNWFDPKQPIKLKVSLIDDQDNVHYLAGNGSEWMTCPVLDGFIRLPLTLEEPIANVVALRVTTQGTAGGTQYLYCDNIVLKGTVAADTQEPGETVNKTVLNFEDGKAGDKYVNAAWSEEIYSAEGWAAAALEMNCRDNKVGVDGTTTKFVNFVSDSTTRKFTCQLDAPMASVSKVSLDLGNWFDPKQPINFKVSLLDADGNVYYVVGGAEEWQTYEVQNFALCAYNLEAPVENVVAIVITTCGTQGNTYQYLYCDNIVLEG